MTTRTIFLTFLFATAAGTASVTAQPAPAKPAPAANRVEITVTRQGFTPDHITVKKDQAVILAFTRKTDATCAKAVIVDLGDGKKIEKALPLDEKVEINATFTKAGELTYACGMDMVHGVMTIQ
jgi:plastocyanin domain-containing protein